MTSVRELRELNLAALEAREQELSDEIVRLRLRRATGQLANPMAGRVARRGLARVKTLIQQRRSEESKS